jgi:tetratricopeptide (TPR) repeat protein
MSAFKWFASFVLAATIVPALPAEPHCPGNVASVPFRLANRYQMIVAVSVNHSGPYNFLLDTGTQMTMVDPALAAELHLNTQGSARVAGVGFLASAPVAQLDLLEVPTTDTLQANIRSAVERNASAEELGTLWLALANRYQDRFELEKAEDSYARAIHLLRDTSSQNQYAESLQGMGNVYTTLGRLREARKYLTKSFDIYATLNEEANIAHLRVALGWELLTEHKYREAEIESTAALKGLEFEPKPDLSDLSMAYLTRSRAVCGQGHCRSALDDVSRALSVALNRLHENSIEVISIRLVQGQIQMKAGLQADGEQAMKEALRLVQSRTDLPRPYFVTLQLVVLRAQRTSLKAAHRQQEAKHVEDQIARIEADAPPACTGCTVSAPALMSQGIR